MSVVKYVKPNDNLIRYVANNMRYADKIECQLASGLSPLQALQKGVNESQYSSVVIINNKPCAIAGLTVVNVLLGVGVPWMLATHDAVKNRRVFINNSRQGVQDMLEICPNLFNYVHVENKVSIRWLKWMGFKFDEPVAIGHNGAMFHKFYIGDCYV